MYCHRSCVIVYYILHILFFWTVKVHANVYEKSKSSIADNNFSQVFGGVTSAVQRLTNIPLNQEFLDIQAIRNKQPFIGLNNRLTQKIQDQVDTSANIIKEKALALSQTVNSGLSGTKEVLNTTIQSGANVASSAGHATGNLLRSIAINNNRERFPVGFFGAIKSFFGMIPMK